VLVTVSFSCNNNSKAKIDYLNWNGANEIAKKTLVCFKEKANQLGVEVIDIESSIKPFRAGTPIT
jgi:hypothetical protein